MTATEQTILNCLVELDEAVRTMKTASPRPDFQKLFARLDELTEQLPGNTDPGLLHYLRKKSYEKARLFLLGRDKENITGSCGHVL